MTRLLGFLLLLMPLLALPQRMVSQVRPDVSRRETPPPPPATPLMYQFAVPVLMYHRICDLTEREARSPLMRDLTVSPADFEQQIRYLVENDFTILSVGDVETALLQRRPLPERAVALTMDDGYRDNFTCAFPILARYGVPATVFLVTSVVGDGRHLSWEEARRMQVKACGFQSHTVYHYDLTTLTETQLDEELRGSKQAIEAQLDAPVTQVAYPSGSYNAMVTRQARQAGYAIGWKKGGGPVTPDCDPYLLPRVRVHGRTDMEDFKRKVWSGVYTRQLREERRMSASPQGDCLAFCPDDHAQSRHSTR